MQYVVTGATVGVKCEPNARPNCICQKLGIGHKTTILKRYKYRGRVTLAIRYWHEYPEKEVSNRPPLAYLKPFITREWIQDDVWQD